MRREIGFGRVRGIHMKVYVQISKFYTCVGCVQLRNFIFKLTFSISLNGSIPKRKKCVKKLCNLSLCNVELIEKE